MCIRRAIMDVCDIFTHGLPAAAPNRWSVLKYANERGRAIRLKWLMLMHMQGVEGKSVRLSGVVPPHPHPRPPAAHVEMWLVCFDRGQVAFISLTSVYLINNGSESQKLLKMSSEVS